MKARALPQGYMRQVLCTLCHRSAAVRGANRQDLRAAEAAWRVTHACVEPAGVSELFPAEVLS